jgi:hypothetical protein
MQMDRYAPLNPDFQVHCRTANISTKAQKHININIRTGERLVELHYSDVAQLEVHFLQHFAGGEGGAQQQLYNTNAHARTHIYSGKTRASRINENIPGE